ncbi:D-alanyl-D-alanine carboxypeptidase/D-alanyl-D-alanine-endopeptidase [Kytococcus sp. Marseille-QA3725]
MKPSLRNSLIASTSVVALVGAYVTADSQGAVPGPLGDAPAAAAAEEGDETDLLDSTAGAPNESSTADPDAPLDVLDQQLDPGAANKVVDGPTKKEEVEKIEKELPEREPLVEPLDDSGEAPSKKTIEKALGETLDDEELGFLSLDIRDAATGEVVYQKNGDRPNHLASMTKLVSVGAITESGWDLDQRLPTRALLDEGNNIVIVAGGDTMLSRGMGDPLSVAGRAGLKDLARQVAAEIEAKRKAGEDLPDEFQVAVDDSQGGPLYSEDWSDVALNEGWTGKVTMLQLFDDRARHLKPTPADPTLSAAGAFAQALHDEGVKVKKSVPRTKGKSNGEQLGVVKSAPVRQQLIHALQVSDNARVETLTRQAGLASGGLEVEHSGPSDVGKWVVKMTKERGIDNSGHKQFDAAGLTSKNEIPAQVLGELLKAGASGDDPEYGRILGNLSMSGLYGTLADRFYGDGREEARGFVRGKTGTLPMASGIAGTTVTKDGRLLTFVVSSDDFERSTQPMVARKAHDELVAALQQCECNGG